jgi:hypothetical protein
MPRADGPHTRNSRPGVVYRGSKKRAARLSPFEELPLNFWLFAAVALLMLGLSVALIYQAL